MAKLFKLNEKPKSLKDYHAQVDFIREEAVEAIVENRSMILPEAFLHDLYNNVSKEEADKLIQDANDIVESFL